MARIGRRTPILPVYQTVTAKPAYFTSIGSGKVNVGLTGGYANITHNIPVGTSALLVAAEIYWLSGASASTLAQIGSTPLTLLGGGLWRNYTGVFVWGMLNPPSGIQTIGVQVSNVVNAYGSFNSFTYNNVSSFDTVVTNTGLTTNMSQSVTSTQTVFQAFGAIYGTSITSYLQTSRWITPPNNHLVAAGDSQGSATFTATLSVNSGYGWGSAAVPLISTAGVIADTTPVTQKYYKEPSALSLSTVSVTRGRLF